MQNYQQNSYNINAGYYINLLTVGYNLPAVFRVGINALCIQRISAIADNALPKLIQYIRSVFVNNALFCLSVTC